MGGKYIFISNICYGKKYSMNKPMFVYFQKELKYFLFRHFFFRNKPFAYCIILPCIQKSPTFLWVPKMGGMYSYINLNVLEFVSEIQTISCSYGADHMWVYVYNEQSSKCFQKVLKHCQNIKPAAIRTFSARTKLILQT